MINEITKFVTFTIKKDKSNCKYSITKLLMHLLLCINDKTKSIMVQTKPTDEAKNNIRYCKNKFGSKAIYFYSTNNNKQLKLRIYP